MKTMLSCGHAANATDGNGKPSCAICAGIHESVPVDAPDLTGRVARCGCGKERPSTLDGSLAFFEFRGEGSRDALEMCKNCHYARTAHDPDVMARNFALKCTNFEPHGAYPWDNFYCGCRGWG